MVHLTVFDVDIWFKHGKPVLGVPKPPFSNYCDLRTISRARTMAAGIIHKYPNAVVQIERYIKHGRVMKVETWANRKE